MEIRRYAPGDPVRHILWKVYARTRQLNVRVPERAIDRSRRTISYLLAGPEDEAAAAVARVALEQNLLGERWLFAADGSPEPQEEIEPALRAIARSGNLEQPTGLGGLHRSCAGPTSPPRNTAWSSPRLRPISPPPPGSASCSAQASAGKSFTLVFGSDGVLPEKKAPLWRRILFQLKRDPALTTSTDLQQLLARCEASPLPGNGGRAADRPHVRRGPFPVGRLQRRLALRKIGSRSLHQCFALWKIDRCRLRQCFALWKIDRCRLRQCFALWKIDRCRLRQCFAL